MWFNLFGNRKNRKESDESRGGSGLSSLFVQILRGLFRSSSLFLIVMGILALIGCIPIGLYSGHFWSVGMLVAGAALLSGFLLGFIFAIPRVDGPKRDPGASQLEDQETPRNGNLVEISDWLTKIIVGVGLVELHSISGELGKLARYLAPGLQPVPCVGGASCAESLASAQAVGLAILTFYFALGFLLGYVWTMIFFQSDLERKLKDAEEQKENERRQKESERRQKKDANRIRWVETLISDNQLDKAMASIDEALKNEPQNVLFVMTKARILKRQAIQPGQPDRDKLLKQALAYADQAIALLPEKGEPFYNRACYQALLDPNGLKSEVLKNLESAFRLNPGLRQVAQEDDDLAKLRKDAEFVKLTGQVQTPDG
jgi:hypothetical protein